MWCQERDEAVNERDTVDEEEELIERVLSAVAERVAVERVNEMDIMESLSNYKEEEQINILTTLNVVQDQGWSATNQDPLQFHIIVGGKITAMEEKIKSLESVLENNEDQNLQKNKNINDLKSELKKEREINADLEQQLNCKESEVEHLEKCMKTKEVIINDLENIVKERVVEEISVLRENNISPGTQIAEAINLEKKVTIQTNVIKELQDALKEKEKVLNVEMTDEIDKLVKEIEQLQRENEDKETILKSFNDEKDDLQNNVKTLEVKIIELKKEKNENENVLSVSEELEQLSNSKFLKPFKCNKCEQTFDSRSDLRGHIINKHEKEEWRIRVQNIERKLSNQKLNIISNLYKLKEIEIKESHRCRCRGFCRINHSKYNWSKSKTDEMVSNFEDSNVEFAVNIVKKGTVNSNGAFKKKYSCDQCDETYVKQGELKKHKKTNHGTSTLTGA